MINSSRLIILGYTENPFNEKKNHNFEHVKYLINEEIL